MYNNLYDSTSETRQKKGGRWVYINGELYHAGIKGMQWGKHLPGTDWWKIGKNAYNRYMSGHTSSTKVNTQGGSATLTGKPSKIAGIGYAGKVVATYAGNQARNTARRIGNKVGSAATSAYNTARRVGTSAYNTARRVGSKVGNKISSAATNAYESLKVGSQRVAAYAKAGASKVASYAKKYANQTISSVKNIAKKSKIKVDNFLRKLGLKESRKRVSKTDQMASKYNEPFGNGSRSRSYRKTRPGGGSSFKPEYMKK